MKKVDISLVKELRKITGLPVMKCKKALEEADGNIEKAKEILVKRGIEVVAQKKNREAKEGLIDTYLHPGGKIGVMVEINCETDFVAKTSEFKQLVKDIGLQVAATNPISVTTDDIPSDVIEERKKWWKEEFSSKPSGIQEKIIKGKLEEFFSQKVLLEQPFIKDMEIKIKDYLNSVIAKVGEKITIRRFVRYELNK